MLPTLFLTLKRQARWGGGDRYETEVEGEERPFAIYLPQTLTRTEKNQAVESLTISVEANEKAKK